MASSDTEWRTIRHVRLFVCHRNNNSWVRVSLGMQESGWVCWYMLFNGLTVTQKNTSETDGYLSWKGQSQSVLPFSLPLCHVVLFFFFSLGGRPAALTQQFRQKDFCLSLEWGGWESLTLMVFDDGNWTMIGCKMSGFRGWDWAYIFCGTLIVMDCSLTHCYCWWWKLQTWSLREWLVVSHKLHFYLLPPDM